MSDHHTSLEDAYSDLINNMTADLFELEPGPGSCCKLHFLMGVLANFNASVILNAVEDGEEFLALEAVTRETGEIIETLLPQKAEALATRQ